MFFFSGGIGKNVTGKSVPFDIRNLRFRMKKSHTVYVYLWFMFSYDKAINIRALTYYAFGQNCGLTFSQNKKRI